jgi:diguanylate cyclase (GGDEF)-like protein
MVRDFYLCLFEETRKADGERIFAEQMTDTACLVHSLRDKQDNGMPMISFSRRELLPQMAERADEPQVFYLTLLHQREFNYGYAVFHYDSGELPTAFFQHWSVTLSGALRNIHNRDELRRLYEERRLSSITDVLTRLNNRRGMMEKVEPHWNTLCAEHAAVGFVSFDLDNLKGVNDTYGHQAGDFAIRLIADAIRATLPKNAVSARMGGDEFLVFIPRTSEMDTQRFVRSFERKLQELNRKEDRSFQVSASAGAYVTTLEEGAAFEDCLHHSDKIMYAVKEKHRQARKALCR